MRYQITTERTQLFAVNAMIGVDILVNGQLKKEQIIGAFHRAVLCHEILNTKVVFGEDGKAFFEECDEHHNSVFFTESSLKDIWKTQEKIRFQIENGEYLKLFVRNEGCGLGMTFLMHHLVGDCKSLIYFIESFMKLLQGENVKYSSMRRLSVLDLPKDSNLSICKRLMLYRYNHRWEKENSVFGLEDLEKEYQQFWKTHETSFTIQKYAPQKLMQVKKEAAEIGCDLTAYMLTLFLQSRQGEQKVELEVNSRVHDNRAMGNQVTWVVVNLEYNQKWSFEKNALYVQKRLDQVTKKNRHRYFLLRFVAGLNPSLVDALNMQISNCFVSLVSEKLVETLGYGSDKKDISINNLMVMDIPDQYGDLRIEKVAFIPPAVPYGKNAIGVITFRDEINVCLHCYNS